MDDISRVVIGMDPHKRPATIEAMGPAEQVLGGGRFGTGPAGFEAMLARAAAWQDRVWAAGAVRASASTWCCGCPAPVSRSWMCRRSCRRVCGSTPPGSAARPDHPNQRRQQVHDNDRQEREQPERQAVRQSLHDGSPSFRWLAIPSAQGESRSQAPRATHRFATVPVDN
jgi:hypothetical protein